jgi:hypothetical protein
MLLDVKLAHGTFTVLDKPATNTLPMEVMEAHQKGFLFVLFYIALTNDAVACLASVLGTR